MPPKLQAFVEELNSLEGNDFRITDIVIRTLYLYGGNSMVGSVHGALVDILGMVAPKTREALVEHGAEALADFLRDDEDGGGDGKTGE